MGRIGQEEVCLSSTPFARVRSGVELETRWVRVHEAVTHTI
jgi:hypothetical protein